MNQFPCRIIFIQSDNSSKESYLRIQVSVEAGKDLGGITCDEILIEAAGEDLKRVPFLILPLFIPDLPIYLLWGQDPTTENTILPYLQRFAKRIIFDSECCANLQHFSQTIQQQFASSATQIVDMNWARIGGWREVIAQTFDSPERIQQLATAKFVKIVYNGSPSPFFMHPETQALYLQAWLASRLEWTFVEMTKQDHAILLHYQGNNHPIHVQLISETRQELLPEEIVEVEVSDQINYVCTLTRQGDNHVVVHASNQFQCELPFTLRLPTIRSGRSFMQEIFYQKISDHYLTVLQLIGEQQHVENCHSKPR